jgi:hypothetical protein
MLPVRPPGSRPSGPADQPQGPAAARPPPDRYRPARSGAGHRSCGAGQARRCRPGPPLIPWTSRRSRSLRRHTTAPSPAACSAASLSHSRYRARQPFATLAHCTIGICTRHRSPGLPHRKAPRGPWPLHAGAPRRVRTPKTEDRQEATHAIRRLPATPIQQTLAAPLESYAVYLSLCGDVSATRRAVSAVICARAPARCGRCQDRAELADLRADPASLPRAGPAGLRSCRWSPGRRLARVMPLIIFVGLRLGCRLLLAGWLPGWLLSRRGGIWHRWRAGGGRRRGTPRPRRWG